MAENQTGEVVTFYSYKGGTGRTMALANVAWILAANGKRVLVVDWDLESPGLDRFFKPFIKADDFPSKGGVIDLIREFEWETSRTEQRDDAHFAYYARVRRHAFSLTWPSFPRGATLDFLSAGRQNNDYSTTLSGTNWDDFYERQGGGLFFDALRADMKRHYDYTLIDSRTGLSDVADICTMHLPDVLVDCFTVTEQGIDGAVRVARAVERYRRRNIRILPVAMRVDPAEKQKADAGRLAAKQRFVGLPADMDVAARERYWAGVQVPYRAYYGYEETLATFGDTPGEPGSLLAAYEMLTAQITNGAVTSLPPMAEEVRRRIVSRFERHPVPVVDEVTLHYSAKDKSWAEWISAVLTSIGVEVHEPPVKGAAENGDQRPGTQLMIVSGAYAAAGAEGDEVWPEDQPEPLAVFLQDIEGVRRAASARSVWVRDLTEEAAAARILELVGHADAVIPTPFPGPRFPGRGPAIFEVAVRNERFTGREADLRELRDRLLYGGQVVISGGIQLVALQGMGGIGKSQLALEYAHRFASAYDVVWWIRAEQIAFVDVQMGDLGKRLGLPLNDNAPAGENANLVKQALSRGEPYKRWLLIFDNAEVPERLQDFVPSGPGHVLITSRSTDWRERVPTMELDVFQRGESIEHLLSRVRTITGEEAGRVADALGNLPIAIAAAAAWLAETGQPVADYLREVERTPAAIAPADSTEKDWVEATWDLSLQRLREQSPAAFRLLQLCSVMASEIAIELLYSEELGRLLTPFDPAVSEPLVRGVLIRRISRLALMRLDQGHLNEQGTGVGARGNAVVHRLLQLVVRDRMEREEPGSVERAQHEVHLMLAAFRPEGEVEDPETWPRFRMIWSHLEVSNAVSCEDEAVRRLLIDRVRYLYTRGDNPRGLERAEYTEKIWLDRLERMRGIDSTSTQAVLQQQVLQRQLLYLRFNKANLLRDLGRFEESHALDKATLAEQRQLLGPEHPHSLMTAGGYAASLRGLGLYPLALEYDQETYTIWSDVFGELHRRTLRAANNLASSYRLMGDYQRALELDETIFKARRTLFGDRNLDTLWSSGLIGRDLREAGEYERSVAHLMQVVQAYKEELGPNSRLTHNANANYAISLRAAGRAEDARRLLDEAYEFLALISPTHPETLACRLSLAMNYFALGSEHYREAETELAAVHTAYRDSLGPRHPHTLVCVNNLAMIHRAKEDYLQARSDAAEAAQVLSEVLGDDHPYTLAARTNLAVCAAESGHLDEALAVIDDTIPRIAVALGEDHPDTLRCLANQALIRSRLARGDEEVADLQVRLAAKIGANHPAMSAFREGRFLHRIIDPHPF